MDIKDNNGRLEIDLPGVLDLPVTAELRDILLEQLARDTGAEITLSAAGVERVSTASVQVLLAAAHAFTAAARRIEVEHPSDSFTSAFHHLGLDTQLDQLRAS